MTKRQAKKWVCIVMAGLLLDEALITEGIVEDVECTDEDVERIRDAMDSMACEMQRRGKTI